jgi:uncharacterized membrane protein HdeD (DUF308 family)
MFEVLTRRWWIFLVRGIAAVVFGILALSWPGAALVALTVLFGAYAFVDGLLALFAAASGADRSRWWIFLIEGLVGLIVAFFVATEPVLSAISLLWVIAFWAIVTGVMEIIAGVQMRDHVKSEVLYIIAGVLSVALGIWIMRDPAAGVVAVAWIIAYYAILFGILQIGLAFRLRHVHAGSVPLATAR